MQLTDPYNINNSRPLIEVMNFRLIATGTYQDLQLRPYNGTMNNQALQLFGEVTRGGTDVSVASLSGISGYIVTPSTAPAGNIAIANGFNNPRVRFHALVRVTRQGARPHFQSITGYTDYAGINFDTRQIDPNMRFTLNSCMVLNETPDGSYNIQDNSHILFQTPAYTQVAHTGFTQPRMFTVMPEDVMNHIGYQDLGSGMGGDGFDGRAQSAMSPVIKSSRSNSLTANYLDRTLNSYSNVIGSPEAANMSVFQIASAARVPLAENKVHTDNFIMMLRQATEYNSLGTVAYGELCNLLPGLDNIVEVVDNRVQLNGGTQFGQVQGGNFSDWRNQTPETIFTTKLIQTVPAIMMELCMTKGTFSATNMTNNGSECQITMDELNGIIPTMNLEQPARRMYDRLVGEVFRDLSLRNQISYGIHMTCNVFGESMIRVQLNGQAPVDYCMPSFCDALAVPVLANNTLAINSVAHTIQTLAGSVGITPMGQHSY